MTFLSGIIWITIGIFLLRLGLDFLFGPQSTIHSTTPLIDLFKGLIGHKEAAVAIAAIGLYIGFLKGKHVLSKAASKGIERILSLPDPTPIHKIYSLKYYLLIGAMILLGLSLKYLGVPTDIRGAVDIAVGSALINGSIKYFRTGFELQKT